MSTNTSKRPAKENDPRPVAEEQDSLPGLTDLPEGFRYRPDFIDPRPSVPLSANCKSSSSRRSSSMASRVSEGSSPSAGAMTSTAEGCKQTDAVPAVPRPRPRCGGRGLRLESALARTSAADRIRPRRIHRLAQGSPGIRRRHRRFAAVALHLQVPAKNGSEVGAPIAQGRADARRICCKGRPGTNGSTASRR